jgi:NADH-quinone oxidoreductase subunit N
VNFDKLVQSIMLDTTGPGGSLWAFRSELALCATILIVLLAKVFVPRWKSSSLYLTLLGLFAAVSLGLPYSWPNNEVPPPQGIFTAVLISDGFTVILRLLLLGFALLFATFTQVAGAEADQEDTTEFYVLMLGALLGMCLMISANHVLMILLGVEMASVPCYVLAGMKRNQSRGSEAAMKYAVFGAGAAGIMLFGLSLLVGVFGSAHLPTMAARMVELLHEGVGPERSLLLVLGGLMLGVGVAFKLSAFPFHFWAPDVFEGATAEVAAFLSVASKAAALGLLVRLVAGLSFPTDLVFPAAASAIDRSAAAVATLQPVRQYIVALISVVAAVTATFGNLAAYGQTNMKRLLAYSTIAHAGYMMMPVAAAAAMIGSNPEGARYAVASLIVYIGIYMFMNLAAFAIVAFLRNATGSEEIADYAGLVRRSPGLTICMAIVLFSLVGLPPLAGFSAKFAAFGALVQAKLWALLAVGVLNTVFSLFYYLRVVRVMALAPEPLHRDAPTIPLLSMAGSYCAIMTLPMIVFFFQLSSLMEWAKAAVNGFFR